MAVGRDARATFLAVVKGDASQAVTEFRKFGTTVEKSTLQASAATSKWRNVTTQAFGEVSKHANMLAGAALAGIVGFAFKGAQQFTALAKSAIDLSKATGLSTEEASRWIAVGDDAAVSAEALTTTISRIGKTLDAKVWQKYGIATRDAGGHALDVNDIMVDTLATLSAMPNATERAQAGTALFGKSWGAIAPLMGKTAAEYRNLLASVSDGQVITDAEAAKAEKLRLAWDEVSDAVRDFGMTLGQMLSAAAPALSLMAEGLGFITQGFAALGGGDAESISAPLKAYSDAAEEAGTKTAALTGPFDEFRTSVYNALSTIDRLKLTQKQVTTRAFGELLKSDPQAAKQTLAMFEMISRAAKDGGEVSQQLAMKYGLTDAALESMRRSIGSSGAAARIQADDLKAAADAAAELAAESWDVYNAQIALINANLGVEGAVQNFQTSLDKLNTTQDDSKTLVDEHAQALTAAKAQALAVAAAVEAQAKQQAEANGETYTAKDAIEAQISALGYIAGTLAPGSELRVALEGYISDLEKTRGTFLAEFQTSGLRGPVKSLSTGQGLFSSLGEMFPKRAAGGPAGGWTTINERGSEIVKLPAGSWVHNAGQSDAMVRNANRSATGGSSNVVNINNQFSIAAGVNPAQTGRQIIDYVNAAYAAGAPKLRAA